MNCLRPDSASALLGTHASFRDGSGSVLVIQVLRTIVNLAGCCVQASQYKKHVLRIYLVLATKHSCFDAFFSTDMCLERWQMHENMVCKD
jgi:hypothetical protein